MSFFKMHGGMSYFPSVIEQKHFWKCGKEDILFTEKASMVGGEKR